MGYRYQFEDGQMISRNELPVGAWPVYVRRGLIPRSGRSWTGEWDEDGDGIYLDGVSVFRGYQMPSGQVAVVADNSTLVSLALGQAVDGVCDGRWYVVNGGGCGTGPDGEPLLRNAYRVRTLRDTTWPVIITD